MEENPGTISSFSISLTPSATGCAKPQNPTAVGPLLRCKDPKIFLSAKTQKATENNNVTKKIIVEITTKQTPVKDQSTKNPENLTKLQG